MANKYGLKDLGLSKVGLHTGTTVPIGNEIHLEKYRYFTVSLRNGTNRHRFVFEYRFVSTYYTSCYLLAPRTANLMTHHVLIFAERVPDTLSGIAFGGKYNTM